MGKQYRERGIVVPRTHNQRLLLDSFDTNQITFALGYPGTGKSYLALAWAWCECIEGRVSRVIISRPEITAGKDPGALPGTATEKHEAYQQHITRMLENIANEQSIKSYIDRGDIVQQSPSFMRGYNFEDGEIVIIDECQNLSDTVFYMLLTRICKGAKIIFCGDTKQSDIRCSGLQSALDKVTGISGVGVVHMAIEDCQRSELVKKIITAWGY